MFLFILSRKKEIETIVQRSRVKSQSSVRLIEFCPSRRCGFVMKTDSTSLRPFERGDDCCVFPVVEVRRKRRGDVEGEEARSRGHDLWNLKPFRNQR
jgi:hypothetical protein